MNKISLSIAACLLSLNSHACEINISNILAQPDRVDMYSINAYENDTVCKITGISSKDTSITQSNQLDWIVKKSLTYDNEQMIFTIEPISNNAKPTDIFVILPNSKITKIAISTSKN